MLWLHLSIAKAIKKNLQIIYSFGSVWCRFVGSMIDKCILLPNNIKMMLGFDEIVVAAAGTNAAAAEAR